MDARGPRDVRRPGARPGLEPGPVRGLAELDPGGAPAGPPLIRNTLFAGCKPEVAAGPDGRILATGARARAAAGRGVQVIRLRGEVWPGLIDSHIHLEGLAQRLLTVDLTGAKTRDDALARVRRRASGLPRGSWVVGSGWYNDAWPDTAFPNRQDLDRAAGGRPVFL